MPLMSQKAYAKRKGVSPQYVNKLVGQGKILRVGRMIDSKQADQAIKAFARAGRVVGRRASGHGSSRAGKARKRGAVPLSKPAVRPRAERQSATRSLTEARAVREHYQAELAKLDFLKTSGSLLPRDQVLEAERRKNATLRASLRRVARALAPELARAVTPAEAEKVLLGEIDMILEQLARDPLGLRTETVPPVTSATPEAVAVSSLPPSVSMHGMEASL